MYNRSDCVIRDYGNGKLLKLISVKDVEFFRDKENDENYELFYNIKGESYAKRKITIDQKIDDAIKMLEDVL